MGWALHISGKGLVRNYDFQMIANLKSCKWRSLQKERVEIGDVIYIEAKSGAVKLQRQSATFATEFNQLSSLKICRSVKEESSSFSTKFGDCFQFLLIQPSLSGKY
jgi:hypothetical protein